MIRYLVSTLIAILFSTSVITRQAVASSICVIEGQSCCLAADSETSKLINALNDVTESIQNNCCCVPAPSHKMPGPVAKIQANSGKIDLQAMPFIVLCERKQVRSNFIIDHRRPLHLASNELYVHTRVLLI